MNQTVEVPTLPDHPRRRRRMPRWNGPVVQLPLVGVIAFLASAYGPKAVGRGEDISESHPIVKAINARIDANQETLKLRLKADEDAAAAYAKNTEERRTLMEADLRSMKLTLDKVQASTSYIEGYLKAKEAAEKR